MSVLHTEDLVLTLDGLEDAIYLICIINTDSQAIDVDVLHGPWFWDRGVPVLFLVLELVVHAGERLGRGRMNSCLRELRLQQSPHVLHEDFVDAHTSQGQASSGEELVIPGHSLPSLLICNVLQHGQEVRIVLADASSAHLLRYLCCLPQSLDAHFCIHTDIDRIAMVQACLTEPVKVSSALLEVLQRWHRSAEGLQQLEGSFGFHLV
mmetsp:Transcript_14341/g.33855  ORF Transcript_14341/g.33855 Transcript_14341/m.33855 type:complete len:208 (-) Transcript_14341:145-768(-)